MRNKKKYNTGHRVLQWRKLLAETPERTPAWLR
jgi:hypothetical protein